MSAKHTPEPWEARVADSRAFAPWEVVAENQPDGWICGTSGNCEANAKRIAACVNACKGIEDPADLRRQRDEMLEALEEVAKLPIAAVYPDGPCIEAETMAMVKKAIAAARGEAKP